MGRMWLYRGRIGKERDGKLGINIDHVTKHSRIEESSIFSVLYQPASASMKSARDISVMSTNLDARRTQQVSFMLLFSCLWPLMGSIQYVNNMIKLKLHVSVCACLQQLHAWMVAMMMMIMFTILYIVMKCCKMDPSVILNEYSSWLFWAREIFHTYTHPPHTIKGFHI